MSDEIRIIDLFAGPGGLGEGFSAFKKRGRARFKIAMSVEKEASAHRTLELRAFVRQFKTRPAMYYEYLRGCVSRDDLFDRFPQQAEAARQDTLGGPKELGNADDDKVIYTRLKKLKRTFKGPWVVIGGPPCQAYSLVGRARNSGVKSYKAEKDARNYLYEEYLKVLAMMRPEVFVMENVPGILSAKLNKKRIFPTILKELRCPDHALGSNSERLTRYRLYSLVTGDEVDDDLHQGRDCRIRSEHYGVPQARHRVILLGVRENLTGRPKTLERNDLPETIGRVLEDLPRLRSGLSKGVDTEMNWINAVMKHRKLVSRELEKRQVSRAILGDALQRLGKPGPRGAEFVVSNKSFKGPDHLGKWLIDPLIGGAVNHKTRGHMTSDLARYLYCACYAQHANGISPRSRNFPEALAPDHKSWETGKFADRFKVQATNRPASTVTSHISKDGHAYIHPDPSQCRSLTLREAARLQTFPDNYLFEGGRTDQYVQVGNAVPPWLAYQIADIVYDLLT